MDWYKRWFGEEYLLVYEHRDLDEAEHEIEAIRDTLDFGKDELILDLCCGPGRHDLPLAKKGYRMIGLDFSMPMLRIARFGKPEEQEYPIFIRGDARHLPFRDSSFDVVLNLFTSFGYFSDDENRGLMYSIARILKPGGRFYIDYLNPPKVLAGLVERSTRDKKEMTIVEERHHNRETNRIEKTITLSMNGHNRSFHESVRLYGLPEMRAMVIDAGLTLDETYGSVGKTPYTETSDRMILLGRK